MNAKWDIRETPKSDTVFLQYCEELNLVVSEMRSFLKWV